MNIGKVVNIIGMSIITIAVVLVLRVAVPLIWDFIKISSQCDTTDYSPIIKKIAVPMQQELEKFYAQNKHFPTTQERDEMLEKVGCKMAENVCVYDEKRIVLEIQNEQRNYYIRYTIENTGCLYALDIKGDVRDIGCGTNSCITWSH